MQRVFASNKKKALLGEAGPVGLMTTKDDAKPYRPMPINPRELPEECHA
jgi:hypothetical protein